MEKISTSKFSSDSKLNVNDSFILCIKEEKKVEIYLAFP